MAEQLFNHFADIQALELEKKKIIGIYGEIKQGIIELSQLGFKIDAGKSIKEITGYQKQITELQGKLVDGQRKIDDATERSRIIQERADKATAARKREELKLREENERAINREVAAEERRNKSSKGGLKDRPIESVPFEVKGSGTSDFADEIKETKELTDAEQELADAIRKRQEAFDQAKLNKAVVDSKDVDNIVAYRDDLEKLTGTLGENVGLQNIYEKELREVNAELKSLRNETNESVRASASYKNRVQELSVRQAELKRESSELNKTIKNQIVLENEASGSLDKLNARLALLNQQYTKLSITQKASPMGQALLKETQLLNAAILTQEKELGRAQKNVGNYSSAISAGASKAFGAIRNLAYLIPGLGLAGIFGLIFESVSKLVSSIASSVKPFKELKEASDALNTSMSSSKYQGVVAEVNNLKTEIQLAKEGFIDKDEVVKHYNETIGKTTGQVNNLKEAEEALNKNAEAYIRFTLLKAAATEVQQRAAKELVDAEIQNQKDLEKIAKIGTGESKPVNKEDAGLVEFVKRGEENLRASEQTAAKKRVTGLENIANKFLKEAAEISKKFNFNFFGDDGGEKGKSQAQKYQVDLKAIFELRKRYLEEQIELEKNLSGVGPIAGRLQAKREQAEFEKKLAKETLDFELQGINQKAEKERENAKNSIKSGAELNRAIGIINQNAANERAVIEDTANKKILESNLALENAILVIKQDFALEGQKEAQEEYDRFEKLQNDKFQIRLEYDERQRREQQDKIEIGRDTELEQLERRFQKQFKAARGNEDKEKRAVKEYEKAKEEILARANLGILKQDLYFYEHRLRLMKAFSTGSVAEIKAIEAAEKQLAATKRAIAEAESKGTQQGSKDTKDEGDPVREALDKMVQVNAVLENAIGGALNAMATRRKNLIQDQIDDIERLKEAEIERINASGDTEERKAARIKLVEAKAAAERENLERKKRQIDLQQARFEKAAAIMNIILNTAVAVSKATTPFGKAIAVASGAVQLGIAIATPLPKFFKGTLSSPAGPAEVGEQGRELAVEPSGRLRLFSEHSVQNLVKGTRIFPNQVTERILAAASVGSARPVQVAAQEDEYGEEIVNQLKEIKKRTGFTVIINQGIDPGWWSKHMKN